MRKRSAGWCGTSPPRTAVRGAVVVVSALSGITDRLLHLAAAAAAGRRAGGRRRSRRAPAAPRARSRGWSAPEPTALRERIAADVAELRNLLHAIGTLEGRLAPHPRRGRRLRRAAEQPHRRSGLPGGGAAGGLDRSAARADHQRHVRLRAAADGGDHRGRRRRISRRSSPPATCRSPADTSAPRRPA